MNEPRSDAALIEWLHRELKVTIAYALKWETIPQDVTSFRANLDEAMRVRSTSE